MSLSRVIREASSAPPVYIGEHSSILTEVFQAEQLLRTSYPSLSLTTDSRGTKSIPLQEIFKIDKLLADARQQAKQAGFQDGFKAGNSRGEVEAKKAVQQFGLAISDAIAQRETMLREAKQHILELVLQISKKVTCDAVQINPETTLKMISGVIDSLTDRSQIKIKVHPDHLAIVKQNMETLIAASPSIKELSVEADPRVHLGGCFIETPSGDIDARLESQFDVVRDALTVDPSDV